MATRLTSYKNLVTKLRREIETGGTVSGMVGARWDDLSSYLVQRGKSGGMVTIPKLAHDLGVPVETLRKAVKVARKNEAGAPAWLAQKNEVEGKKVIGERTVWLMENPSDGKPVMVTKSKTGYRIVHTDENAGAKLGARVTNFEALLADRKADLP